MRVLHVVSTDQRRGAELFASDLIQALTNEGVEQRVCVLRSMESDSFEYGVPTDLLECASRWPVIGVDGLGIRRLRAVVKEWKPDIIQAHGGETLSYSVPAALRSDARVVYRRIGSTPNWMAGRLKKAALGSLMRRADLVIAVADFVRREVEVDFRVLPSKIVVIPNGIDVRRLHASNTPAAAKAKLGIPEEGQVVLSLGALTLEKDPLAQVEIMTRVLEQEDTCYFAMAGDGPLRSELEAAVSRTPCADRIRVLGVRRDVGDLLCAADVLLLASRTEGMPAAILEAGASGVPVASYAIAGVPEIVEDGVTGLLAAPGDVDRLRRRVVELLQDADLRAELGSAGRAQLASRFTIDAIAHSYMKAYRTLATAAAPLESKVGDEIAS